MTCQEFHSYLETSIQAGLNGCAELSEHILACTDCRGLFEVQQEVTRHLRIVHHSAPRVPDSLDATVLANYRQWFAERTARGSAILLRRRIAPKALAWSGAAAAVLLIAGFLTFAVKRNANTTIPPHAVELAKAPQPLNPKLTTAAVSVKNKTNPRISSAGVSRVSRTQPESSAAAAPSLPDGFRSLMYCDQLSCAEAMQVIRVQLPTSLAEPTSTSTSTNDVVFADVLVGPDGIARGIRMVE